MLTKMLFGSFQLLSPVLKGAYNFPKLFASAHLNSTCLDSIMFPTWQQNMSCFLTEKGPNVSRALTSEHAKKQCLNTLQ